MSIAGTVLIVLGVLAAIAVAGFVIAAIIDAITDTWSH